jgi:hypothetical protein
MGKAYNLYGLNRISIRFYKGNLVGLLNMELKILKVLLFELRLWLKAINVDRNLKRSSI